MAATSLFRAPSSTSPPRRSNVISFLQALQKQCWPLFSVGGCDPGVVQNGSPVMFPSSLHRLLLSPTFACLMPSLPPATPAITHLYKNVRVPTEAPFCKLLSTQFPESADYQKPFFSGVSADSQRGTEGLWSHHLLTPLGAGAGGWGWLEQRGVSMPDSAGLVSVYMKSNVISSHQD